MDKTSGNQNEQEQERNNRQSMIEAMIPAGLTGQIRDKARDALLTAVVILGMSRTDILEHIQEIARDNGLSPQSARVWLLFTKEMRERELAVGDKVAARGTQRTYHRDLGYVTKEDTRTLALGAAFTHGVEKAASRMRTDLNRETGDHANSISGKNGVFSYDQVVDGWGGPGEDSRGAGTIGLETFDGETGLDMEIENGDSMAAITESEDEAHEKEMDALDSSRDGDGLSANRKKLAAVFDVDQQEVSRVRQSGSLDGGWHKAARRNEQRERARRNDRGESAVAALDRKMGGFRGTDEEFAAFAKANPDLDRNELRLIKKGLNERNYLGWRVYVANAYLLDNRGRGSARVATQTRSCLLMVSEDAARQFQNELRKRVRILDRAPDPGKEKVSSAHKSRMETSLPSLAADYSAANPDKVRKYEESLKRDKGKKRPPESGLER